MLHVENGSFNHGGLRVLVQCLPQHLMVCFVETLPVAGHGRMLPLTPAAG
jgi:hypothetical protein